MLTLDIRVARNFQLKIGLKSDREREVFDGLVRDVSTPYRLVFARLTMPTQGFRKTEQDGEGVLRRDARDA